MRALLRYTLDLFEPFAPVHPAQAATEIIANLPPQAPLDAVPAAPAPCAPAVAPVVPNAPARSLREELVPAAFAHPRANRALRLSNATVAYLFERARRRTIGFMIGPDGLVVRAPRWTPLHEVDAALQAKAAWITRKLAETRERQARRDEACIDWHDGATFPFLGGTIQVVLDPSHAFVKAGAQLQAQEGWVPARFAQVKEEPAKRAGDTAQNAQAPSLLGATSAATADRGSGVQALPLRILHVALPHSASPQQLRDSVQAWLMRQAQTHFKQRLEHFAPLLQVQWKSLRLSSANTRWGSAKSDGSIRLNWRLMHYTPAVIDYVVAHELSHLRVMDHSPRFWQTVESVLPDYAQVRSQLKDDAMPRW